MRRMVPWLAAAAALLGLVLVLIRPLGMRFSGFLLLGATALLVMDLLLGQWAAVARARKAVETALPRSSGAVLVPLASLSVMFSTRAGPP